MGTHGLEMAEGKESIPAITAFAWMMGLAHVKEQLLHGSYFVCKNLQYDFFSVSSLTYLGLLCANFLQFKIIAYVTWCVCIFKVAAICLFFFLYLSVCQFFFLTVCTLIEKLSLSKMPFRGDPIIGMWYFK